MFVGKNSFLTDFCLNYSRHESISKSLDFKVNIRSNESNGDGTNGKDENSREIER